MGEGSPSERPSRGPSVCIPTLTPLPHILPNMTIRTPATVFTAHRAQVKQRQNVFFEEISRPGMIAFTAPATSAPKFGEAHVTTRPPAAGEASLRILTLTADVRQQSSC